jgi:hypothetical protein
MKERPNQNGFPDTACPLGPASEFEKDSRSFYFAALFRRPYQGRYKPAWARSRGLQEVKRLSRDRFEFSGKRYRRISGPAVVWHRAKDDGKYLSKKPGDMVSAIRRHFHTDFEFRKRRVHVDFLLFIRWGPLFGVCELVFFSDGRFITRGGHCGLPPISGIFNWPLAVPIDKSLITLDGPPADVTGMKLTIPRMKFWIPAK